MALQRKFKIFDATRLRFSQLKDDINDYNSMKLCGFVGCPIDACDEVKAIADYVSPYRGGYGAVRDVISYILKERGEWIDAVNSVFEAGI